MTLGLVGRKVGMTRVFDEQGASVPVTVLEMTPNRVTQLKSEDADGYTAVQVTFGQKKANRVNKPVSWSTLPEPQKVKVFPVQSNDTILILNVPLMVTRAHIVCLALSVWLKIRAVFSRVSAWRANTVILKQLCKI